MLTGMELNFEGLEMQKWKKWLIFGGFFADDSKKLFTVKTKHLKSAPKRSFWVFSKNGMVHRFWSYQYLANGSSESNNP